MTLIEDEKAERERQRQAEEREEMELMQREAERREAVRQRALERERAAMEAADAANSNAQEPEGDQAHQDGSGETPVQSSEDARSGTSPTLSSPPEPVTAPPKMQGSAFTLERTGLCVVCQDEEANIAIVDCGWVHFPSLSSIYFSDLVFSQAYGYVQRLFRSYHGKLARVSPVSYPHRHGSPSFTDFQDLDQTFVGYNSSQLLYILSLLTFSMARHYTYHIYPGHLSSNISARRLLPC